MKRIKFVAALAIWLLATTLAMALTPAQLQVLKNDINADPALSSIPNTPDGAFEVAEIYNKTASPDWWVWKTSVSEADYTRTTSSDNTDWSWTAYINRSQGERDAWARLFAPGPANPSLPNVRQGVADIFSGAQGATQRTHLLAVSRRKATRVEKLFSTGTGSTASPATMTVEGNLSYQDVQAARNLP